MLKNKERRANTSLGRRNWTQASPASLFKASIIPGLSYSEEGLFALTNGN
jgi:hypothetical protein